MGRAPFEVPGQLPIGGARPYQTRPCGRGRPGANNGLPRLFHVNPGPRPSPYTSALPQMFAPPSKRLGGPEGREEVGGGAGMEGPAPELAPARTSPRGCRAARDAAHHPLAEPSSLSKRIRESAGVPTWRGTAALTCARARCPPSPASDQRAQPG